MNYCEIKLFISTKKNNNEFFAYTKQISVLKVFLKDHVTLNDAENSVQE